MNAKHYRLSFCAYMITLLLYKSVEIDFRDYNIRVRNAMPSLCK